MRAFGQTVLRPAPSQRSARFLYGLLVGAAIAGLLNPPDASADSVNVEVVVQTTQCGGETGFASFLADKLFKIEEGWCADPNAPGEKLQQVFLETSTGPGKYDLLWVTQDEAKSIMEQIKAIRDGKLERLKGPRIVIEQQASGPREQAVAPVESVMRGDAAKPEIQIIDPPIDNMRSMTNLVTSSGAESRLIVGRITAPAGLLSLTVNGQATQADDRGLFRSEISMQPSITPVTVTAIDRDGRANTVEFRFLMDLPEQQPVATAGGDVFGDYYALVIANNSYEHLDDLQTPKNDADVVSAILTDRYGFKVTKLYDATRYDVVSELNRLRRELTDKDNLLLYYAGHGEFDTVNNRGHWLPVDAERNSTANWIATSVITDTINAMSTKHVLVVADSCYSGSLARSAITELDPGLSDEARQTWLRTMAATRARFVLTSGGVKPVLDDSGNGHSVFANAFIEVLGGRHDILESATLYREVRDKVEARANELDIQQMPQYSALKATGHEFGEFLLVSRR